MYDLLQATKRCIRRVTCKLSLLEKPGIFEADYDSRFQLSKETASHANYHLLESLEEWYDLRHESGRAHSLRRIVNDVARTHRENLRR